MADTDDDVIPDAAEEPKYEWFQRPAPCVSVTFALAAVFFAITLVLYRIRVNRLKAKFGAQFKGSLRICAKISAYMDNYEDPRFAILRLCTKSFVFLGFLQIDFHMGFFLMWGTLIVESSLDTVRVLLAYLNCRSLENVSTISEDESRELKARPTLLEPTNVYEDLTRPKSIAVMVFIVQGFLIGLVMDDTYKTTTRTCFNGHDGCAMLTSLGSYCLYLMGTFMACVFYVGPRNSYGQKEQNPTFWLKLFLMSNETSSVLSWKDPVTDQVKSIHLAKDDARVWLRFLLSFIINGIGFLFLLHILPIQVAGQSTIIGVVFRAIGMIYLADLDDSVGSTLTLVPEGGTESSGITNESSERGMETQMDDAMIVAEKQKIIDDALEDVELKLQSLMANSGKQYPVAPAAASGGSSGGGLMSTIFQSTFKRDKSKNSTATNEKTPLLNT